MFFDEKQITIITHIVSSIQVQILKKLVICIKPTNNVEELKANI